MAPASELSWPEWEGGSARRRIALWWPRSHIDGEVERSRQGSPRGFWIVEKRGKAGKVAEKLA